METQADILLLEDFTPYDKSLKWEIQNRYYLHRGNEAWLSGEVPYQITSNSVAARQNAELVYTAVVEMENDGILQKKDTIRVLEMASGLGLFATNFILAFQDTDKTQGKGYTKRLKYFFTDYSEKNLHEASQNPTLNAMHKEGILEFYILDALNPEQLLAPSTKKQVIIPPLTAIIANYVHCCLPVKILRKKDGNFFEKHIRLSLKRTDKTEYLKSRNEVLGQLTGITENLVEETSWKEVGDEIFLNPMHRKVVENTVAKFNSATVIYPYGSFASIEKALPKLLQGGIIIISDKGYADVSAMEGEKPCEPSIHGNSFAHSLNFPLIETLLVNLGFAVIRTKNPLNSLQTILIENRKRGVLAGDFDRLFIRNNSNFAANDFYQAGRKFESQKEHLIALRFFERARNLSSNDAYLYYYMGLAYFEYGYSKTALEILRKGQKFDYFSKFDFDFEIAYILHMQNLYTEAIPYYQKSLKRERTSVKLYDLGLCYEYSKEAKKAEEFYKEALRLNPDYDKVKEALNRL